MCVWLSLGNPHSTEGESPAAPPSGDTRNTPSSKQNHTGGAPSATLTGNQSDDSAEEYVNSDENEAQTRNEHAQYDSSIEGEDQSSDEGSDTDCDNTSPLEGGMAASKALMGRDESSSTLTPTSPIGISSNGADSSSTRIDKKSPPSPGRPTKEVHKPTQGGTEVV